MYIEFTVAVIVAAAIAIGIIWLSFGRQISELVDRQFPGRAIPKPIDPFLLGSDNFTLGSLNWALPGAEEFELKFAPDQKGSLVLYAEGEAFTLGPIQKMWDDPIKPQFQFIPEPGDVVSFTRDISRLPWPTPFTFSILGAATPKWKRYAYDRLRWIKPGGAKLEITWRDEYWFYRRSGWQDVYINRWAGIKIHPSPIEKAAAKYLAKTKGWTGSEYRLEIQSNDPKEVVIAAIYLKDEAAAHPSAGKSVMLRVDKSSRKVVSETGWQ